MTRQTECAHERFGAQVNVTRLSHEEGGSVTGYTADVEVKCLDCDLPFRWLGVPAGYSQAEPRVCALGTELRAPLEPAYVPELLGQPQVRGTA